MPVLGSPARLCGAAPTEKTASDAAATPRRPLDLTRALALAMERHLGRVAVMVALDGDVQRHVLRSIVEKLCCG